MTYIKAFIMGTGKTTLSGYAIISTGRRIKGHLFLTHILSLKWFNIQRLQVGSIDFASSLTHVS